MTSGGGGEDNLAKDMVHSFFDKIVTIYDNAIQNKGLTHEQAIIECEKAFPFGKFLPKDKIHNVITQILKQRELR